MTIENQYLDLLKDILHNGIKKSDRTGTGTISVFGRQLRHKMSEGFPLLTTKKMYFKGVITELLWFLRGDTNIKYLVDNDCHIWNGDAYKNYTNYPLATIHDHHTNILYQNRDKGWCMLDGRSIVSPHPTRHLTQEEFINKIKTDDEFADKWGELGPVYGAQWRDWKFTDKFTNGEQIAYVNGSVDQIKNLIDDLKNNPDSRRLMVNAWNPGKLSQMVLPPCHYGFQCYTRELNLDERFKLWENFPNRDVMDFPMGELTEEQYHKVLTDIGVPERALSLMWNQRSVDGPLGLPFNIASYGLLLEIFAKVVNMVPDEIICNLGDCHIYVNQIEGIKEQLTREPYPLPTLDIHPEVLDYDLDKLDKDLFKVINYQSHPSIKMPLSN